MTTQPFRVEEGTLGPRQIPFDALYGCQTDSAVENF
jgi:aspartate ammonia-lyase